MVTPRAAPLTVKQSDWIELMCALSDQQHQQHQQHQQQKEKIKQFGVPMIW